MVASYGAGMSSMAGRAVSGATAICVPHAHLKCLNHNYQAMASERIPKTLIPQPWSILSSKRFKTTATGYEPPGPQHRWCPACSGPRQGSRPSPASPVTASDLDCSLDAKRPQAQGLALPGYHPAAAAAQRCVPSWLIALSLQRRKLEPCPTSQPQLDLRLQR